MIVNHHGSTLLTRVSENRMYIMSVVLRMEANIFFTLLDCPLSLHSTLYFETEKSFNKKKIIHLPNCLIGHLNY